MLGRNEYSSTRHHHHCFHLDRGLYWLRNRQEPDSGKLKLGEMYLDDVGVATRVKCALFRGRRS